MAELRAEVSLLMSHKEGKRVAGFTRHFEHEICNLRVIKTQRSHRAGRGGLGVGTEWGFRLDVVCLGVRLCVVVA